MNGDHKDSLLKEYEVSQNAVIHQDNMAWVIGGIIIVQSFAGLYLMAAVKVLYVAIIMGLFSIALLWLWYFIYKRWTSFVEVAHYRMQEIEEELGLWKNRYINYLDHEIPKDPDNSTKERLSKLFSALKKKHKRRSLHRNVRIIVVLAIISGISILVIRSLIYFNILLNH